MQTLVLPVFEAEPVHIHKPSFLGPQGNSGFCFYNLTVCVAFAQNEGTYILLQYVAYTGKRMLKFNVLK